MKSPWRTEFDLAKVRGVMRRSRYGLRDLPIGTRLFTGFLMMTLLLGAVGFLAAQQFNLLTATTTELNTRDLPEVIAVGQLQTVLLQERSLVHRIANSDTERLPVDAAGLDEMLARTSTRLAALLTYEPADSVPAVNDTALLHRISTNITQYAALARQVRTLAQNGDFATARALEQQQGEPMMQAALDGTGTLLGLEQAETTATALAVQSESKRATFFVILLIAIALPISVLLALLITRSLTRPLLKLVRATEALGAGDLETPLRAEGADELGRLTIAFDSMREKLRTMMATLAIERRQTQAIIDATADGILLVDTERTILRLNPAAQRYSGWGEQEAVGRHCWEVFGCRGATPAEAEEHERLCPLRQAPEDGEANTAEMHALLRSGRRHWFSVSCSAVRPESIASQNRLVVGVHDIAEMKAIEQVRSDFVAMVSHELRAPLTTVSSAVEMMGLLDPAHDGETYHEVLAILDQQTHRLRKVVEDVLQVTRVDAGRLRVHTEAIALLPWLDEFLAKLRLEWVGERREAPVRVLRQSMPEARRVWADPALLELVLRNLLENARKFASPESPIDLVLDDAPESKVHLRIRDQGPGIPETQLERVFDRFTRGTGGPASETPGHGLGLYIARELMRAQSGAVWAEAQEGGACLVVALCGVAPEEEVLPALSTGERRVPRALLPGPRAEAQH